MTPLEVVQRWRDHADSVYLGFIKQGPMFQSSAEMWRVTRDILDRVKEDIEKECQ